MVESTLVNISKRSELLKLAVRAYTEVDPDIRKQIIDQYELSTKAELSTQSNNVRSTVK